ncbi:MAG: hypothetical protein WC998_01165 [Candidatus Paceibacterota bacterium]
MKKKIFIIEFLFFCLGTAQLFEKTKNGKLIFLNNAWTYVLGTEKEDFEALLGLTKESQKEILFWGKSSIAVEANDINECLKILLSYVRCGHNRKINSYNFALKTFIDKNLNGLKPSLDTNDINFQNWPIKIESAIAFPHCICLKKDWTEGIPLCGGSMNTQIVKIDVCPIFTENSVIDEGDCPPITYLRGESGVKIAKQKINIHGQEFFLEEVSCQE